MTLSPIQTYLDGLVARLSESNPGAVADYIPELASAPPDRLGVALATVDGAVYVSGDSGVTFSIQSMSKPFTYALALWDRGFSVVDRHLGVEPTGDAFNSISLEPGTGRPRNPMINAGAIIATALVEGDRDARILGMYSRLAGRELGIDEPVFESERETGHRNRAIGHMLRAVDILHEHPDRVLDAYFRQCATAVDCRDVALMAATLANGGVQPVTGERVLDPATIRRVLSVMTTCGMYDGAGDWLVGVGLPAKSGVAGGVMAVLPGQLGLCVFSPRLDELGNSVRGVEACRRISTDLGLHSLEVARASHGSLRRRFTLTAVPSTRRRPTEERTRLTELGSRCAIYELQGDLVFGAVERVIRQIVEDGHGLDLVVLDLQRCSAPDPAMRDKLAILGRSLAGDGKTLVVVSPDGGPAIAGARTFERLDPALEWCEWQLLGLEPQSERPAVGLDTHPVSAALTPDQRARLAPLLIDRPFAAGELIVRAGDEATGFYLLIEGEVAVQSAGRRLATLTPGAVFGETALLAQGRRRTVDIVAERPGRLAMLPVDAFEALTGADDALQAALLRSLLTATHEVVVRLTGQLGALA